MRLSFPIPILLLLIVAFSCNNKPSSDSEANSLIEESNVEEVVENEETIIENEEVNIETEEEISENEELFPEYLSFFENDSLPITIISREINTNELACLKLENYIKIREKSAYSDPSFCAYKNILTTDKFTTLLSIENNYVYNAAPVLETYSPDGSLISLKELDFRWEESENTEVLGSKATINADLTFWFETTTRTVELIEQQDQNGNYELIEVEGSAVNSREWVNGHVDSEGIIHLEEAQNEVIE